MLVITAAWGKCAWLLSDELRKRKPKSPKKQKPRLIEKYEQDLLGYRSWQLIVPLLLVLALASGGAFVNDKFQQKILSQREGFLLPANDSDPPGCELKGPFSLGESYLRIYLGKVMVAYSVFPHVVMTVNQANPLILDRDSSRKIALTIDIFDQDKKIVVSFEKGHFIVNENASFDMKRPDLSTLLIRDNYKNEVLNMRYVNKNSMVISGLLHYPGANQAGVRIPKSVAGVCLGDVGSVGYNIESR